jgi:Putative zinc-finger
MNCEKSQDLIHDLLDGTLSVSDESALRLHLNECLDCETVRQDLSSIVSFCLAQRGEYEPVPNERAMWLRIRNVVEAESVTLGTSQPARKSFLSGLMGRSWELSLPQLASFAVAIMLFVSLATVVGLRRWESPNVPVTTTGSNETELSSINDRMWQQQQVINYWNQRVELNKARWNPQMRETFDRNMKVIDQAVSQSLNELHRNPHDEVSEQMLNDSLNDKLSLLKEFADL